MNDLPEIYHWRRFTDRITTSGQPSEKQLQDIANLGVTHIVNLGMHDHERALPDEAASVEMLGLKYIHIPVDFSEPTELDFETFCMAMSEYQDEKLHIHCIANLRVTAFLYRYQQDILGVSDADARTLMDSVWRPGGVWAKFIGDEASIYLEHRPPKRP